MPTKTDPPIPQGKAEGYPSAQWLYDELMQHIEPDLLTDQIAHADEKYAGESDEDRAARYERYTIAFMAFEDALVGFEERLRDDVTMWRMEMEAYVRAVNANEEQAKMQSIEQALDDTAPQK